MLGDHARHFWMARSVARVMGLNLSDQIDMGRLRPEDYRVMVAACRGCALVEQCEKWLATQSDLAKAPPPGCRISAPLMRLCRTV
ncbi:DUF6455 family protein [Salipiger mangrovisoli]|uniref:DUF6455 family protein n=1 Tax=Salipiger mangrovisoli TaxID=2865933 RepID=UPI001F1194BC|nr:DUF6455 family protein [Salipiger mangrovisoli]